jgi:hypothetical protein
MKKNYKKLALIFLILSLLNGCQSIKDGLEGNKKSKSAEEFLIQKKNPLVLPPDYSKLPLPKNVAKNEESKSGFDLEKKLKKNLNTNKNPTKKLLVHLKKWL